MFNKKSKPQNRIDSLIGATTRIEGNVVFSGGLRVDGMVRGNVAALRAVGGLVDLGVVTCIENDSTDLTSRTVPDSAVPPVGQAFFYLVRQNPKGSGLGYGASSAHAARQPASGDCL